MIYVIKVSYFEEIRIEDIKLSLQISQDQQVMQQNKAAIRIFFLIDQNNH